MTVIEKVAYLRGLADGLKLTDTTAEGKVLLNVIEVLDDLALSVTDLEDAVEELGEVVDAIDDDLQDVEDALYEEDDEDEDYDFDEDDDYGLDDYDEFDDEGEPLKACCAKGRSTAPTAAKSWSSIWMTWTAKATAKAAPAAIWIDLPR